MSLRVSQRSPIFLRGFFLRKFGKYSWIVTLFSDIFWERRKRFVLAVSWENTVMQESGYILCRCCTSVSVMSSSPRFSAPVAVKRSIFMCYLWWRFLMHQTVLSPIPVRLAGICSMIASTDFLSYHMPMSEVMIDWSMSEYTLLFFWLFFWTSVMFWSVSVSSDPRSSTIILLASFGPIPLAWVSLFDSPLAIACMTSFCQSSRRAMAHFGPRPFTERSLLNILLSSIVSNPIRRDHASVWWWYIQSLRVSPRLLSQMVFDCTVTV